MALATYGDLQTTLGTWLNRTDLATTAPDLITLAEARLKRDHRIRKLVTQTIMPAADDYALPPAFIELVALYYDTGNYYGPLKIVHPDQLGELRGVHGETGTPVAAAVMAEEGAPKLRFAPVPTDAVTMKMEYVAALDPLNDSDNTSNALLQNHPDIYLFASLVEAEPFLMEDERIPVWEGKLQNALNEYYRHIQRQEMGGHMIARPSLSIGGDV